jgi:hypothetical protein
VSDALVSTREEQAILARIRKSQGGLAQIDSIETAKDERDKTRAIGDYLANRKAKLPVRNAAAALIIGLERTIGAMLRDMPMHGGDRKSESRSHDVTLNALGINRMASHRWQTMAGRRDARSDCRRRRRGPGYRHAMDARGVNFCKCKS